MLGDVCINGITSECVATISVTEAIGGLSAILEARSKCYLYYYSYLNICSAIRKTTEPEY